MAPIAEFAAAVRGFCPDEIAVAAERAALTPALVKLDPLTSMLSTAVTAFATDVAVERRFATQDLSDYHRQSYPNQGDGTVRPIFCKAASACS